MTDITNGLQIIEDALERVISGGAYTHPSTVEIAKDIFVDVEQALAIVKAIRAELQEMDKYLSVSKKECIGSGSVYHKSLAKITQIKEG